MNHYHSISSKPMQAGKINQKRSNEKNSCCNEYKLSFCRIFTSNLLNDQQFRLREHGINRCGKANVSLDTTSSCLPYVTTLEAIAKIYQSDFKDFPAFPK